MWNSTTFDFVAAILCLILLFFSPSDKRSFLQSFFSSNMVPRVWGINIALQAQILQPCIFKQLECLSSCVGDSFLHSCIAMRFTMGVCRPTGSKSSLEFLSRNSSLRGSRGLPFLFSLLLASPPSTFWLINVVKVDVDSQHLELTIR